MWALDIIGSIRSDYCAEKCPGTEEAGVEGSEVDGGGRAGVDALDKTHSEVRLESVKEG